MMKKRSISGFLVKLGVSLLVPLLALVIVDAVARKVNPSSGLSRFDDARGYQIFTSRCEVCHAKEPSDLGKMGPNLGRIGAEAATRRPGLNGPEYILQSIMEPGAFTAPTASGAMMPANLVADLSDDDVRDLVAHVAQFGATPDDDEIAALIIPRKNTVQEKKLVVRRDQMAHGERVFRQKCQSCHSVHRRVEDQVFAPDLFGVGFPNEKSLRDSIRHAEKTVTERYRSTRVTMSDGTVLIGNVFKQTPTELMILSTRAEDQGEIITVHRADIRKGPDGTPMVTDIGFPPGLSKVIASLTPEDIDALVALLQVLD